MVAVALLLLTVLLRRRGWLWPLALGTAVLLGATQWRLDRLQRDWPAERERRIETASGNLAEVLREARLLADSLALRATRLTELQVEDGFDAIEGLVPLRGLEAGVILYGADTLPRVWGGRFRLLPSRYGDSVNVRLTPYYAVLEVRRHAPNGQVALATVLLAANDAVPDRDRSLASRFREDTEVGLLITAPNAAPNNPDVFDYTQPTTGGDRVLFSAQFVPPDQARAVSRVQALGIRQVTWALLATLFLAIGLVPAGLWRVALALFPLGLALRAPIGRAIDLPALFDQSLFSSPLLGPVSSAAGPLAIAGLAVVIGGALLWERAHRRRWPGVVLGLALLAGAPYLMAELGRGIIPPSTGVPMGLWLLWEITLFLLTAGLLGVAAALLRGDAPATGWKLPALGAFLALVAVAVGVLVWNARFGWPDWYTVLWVPPLLLATRPADRRAAIVSIAIVAGGAAALLAWGAELEGRLEAARSDMAALGNTPDPEAEVALRALAPRLSAPVVPRNASELYARWHDSFLALDERPAVLTVWNAEREVIAELALAPLDLPRGLVADEVNRLDATDSMVIHPFDREPGVIHLLLVRADSGMVVSVAVGRRSATVPPTRLGRLLDATRPHSPLYRLTLAPAPSTRQPEPGLALWRREGWVARGERIVAIGGTPRDVTGSVELGTAGSLAVRGALVVALDVALLAALWSLAALLGGHSPKRPTWMPELRSFEARLGAALAVFYLTPTLLFAAWGVSRLQAEVDSGRDRMIEQALRDIVPPGAGLPASPDLTSELRVIGERVDADLALYRHGAFVAGSSGGLLESLGILSPLMDPLAYHAIEIHGGEVASTEGPSHAVASRVGYRAVRLSDFSAGVLAMPQAAYDPMLERRQLDLALLLLLATFAGIVASLVAARFSARALSRPVSELRDAALAFGRGEPVPRLDAPASAEFGPVFAAFDKMTADVRRARDAQERVARIVAWGEMANQVAHEIKNPLTPMRLGVQHLRRVYQDRRTAIGPVLEETTSRILSEIDRLDRIARSFSRFGAPASERGPLERVNLPSVLRDVADLYRLGPEGAEITLAVTEPVPVAARVDEVKEAIINLLENSRNAGARLIEIVQRGTVVEIRDDGCGIPAALLPMIFEPRFSTSTSGSGLGLPIVKGLVEGWGGRVEVESAEKGAVVRLHFVPDPNGPGSAPQGSGVPDRAEP